MRGSIHIHGRRIALSGWMTMTIFGKQLTDSLNQIIYLVFSIFTHIHKGYCPKYFIHLELFTKLKKKRVKQNAEIGRSRLLLLLSLQCLRVYK